MHFVFYISFPFAPCALCDVTLGNFFSLSCRTLSMLRERNEGNSTTQQQMHWHYFSLSRKTICDFITCKPLINCKSLLLPYVIPFSSTNPDNLPLSFNFFFRADLNRFSFFSLSFILSHFFPSSFFRIESLGLSASTFLHHFSSIAKKKKPF